MGDTFEHTVGYGEGLIVTVDLGNDTTRTFHILPGSWLRLSPDEVERSAVDDLVLTAALLG